MNDVLKNAILSMDAYNRGYGASTLVSGNIMGYIATVSNIENQDVAGFLAVAYSNGNERIISFRGTDAPNGNDVSGSDVLEGWTIGSGNPDAPQGRMAIKFYEMIAGGGDPDFSIYHDTPIFDMSLTGHSLGGGLASFISTITHQEAVVFDQMPGVYAGLIEVGRQQLSELASDGYVSARPPSVSNIHGFYVSGEVLEHVRSGLLQTIAGVGLQILPGAVGTPLLQAFEDAGFSTSSGLGVVTTEALIDNTAIDNLGVFGDDFEDFALEEVMGEIDEAVSLHSQSFMVTMLFGQTEWTRSSWMSGAASIIPHMFSDSIGSSLGLSQVVDASETSGNLKGDAQIAAGLATGYATAGDQLATRIAYTAIENGGPFGSQAIRIMFDDMSDIGEIIEGSGTGVFEWEGLLDLADGLGEIIVANAARTIDPMVSLDSGGVVELGTRLDNFALNFDSNLSPLVFEILPDDIQNLIGALTAQRIVFVGDEGSNEGYGSGSELVFAAGGGAHLIGSSVDQMLFGSDQSDTFTLENATGVIDGRGGSDTIELTNSNLMTDMYLGTISDGTSFRSIEKVIGTSDSDEFRGAVGKVVDGRDGNDTFTIDQGGTAFGGKDNDTFNLSVYNQIFSINGGDDYDRLIIDRGFKTFIMDTGNFTGFDWENNHGVITGIEEVDFGFGTVRGTSGTDTMIGSVMAKAYGLGGDDYITMNSDGIYNVEEGYGGYGAYGGSGNDYLVSLGVDELYGEGDNDTLVGNGSTRIMDGGSGNDEIHVGAAGNSSVVIITGAGNDTVFGNGSNRMDIQYHFTKEYDPYFDDDYLISVFDRGDYFEVNTSQGTDKIYNAPFIMFEHSNPNYAWATFGLYEGIAWINPNGPPPPQGMSSSNFYEDASSPTSEDPMLAMHDYGMPSWKMASIHEVDYHLV